MNIKNIRITGFKSFYNQTEISFHPGLNAIVGPNGCGKSNISDALKWVMGEHNVRQLRGDRMEDVIFNGSRENKPLGMAEVTMTIDANGGGLPSHFGDFSELEITRRVYRSGESEYFINKKPCLLREIREIFMDTGLNPRAYAVIEQGSIMEIVNSSPQDLRKLLEEAAGITKYRDRKAATLRKIEATRENLSRVNDIIIEVQRQVKAARRQANEAKRYLVFQKELARMEAALYHSQHEDLRRRWETAATRHDEISTDTEKARSAIVLSEAGMEEDRLTILSLEKDLDDAQQTFYRASGRLEVAQTQIGHLTERLKDLSRSRDKERESLAEIEARRRNAAGELSEVETALEATRASLARMEPDLELLRREAADCERRAAEWRRKQEETRREMDLAGTEKRDLLQAVGSAEARLQGDEKFLSDYAEESSRLAAQERSLGQEKEESERRAREISLRLDDLTGSLAEAQGIFLLNEELFGKESAILEESVRLLTEMESRRNLLRNIQREGDNLREGARRLYRLAAEEEKSGGSAAILGHLVRVEDKYRKAMETVLAERLEAVMVGDRETAFRLAGRLKAEGVGGATVISGDAKPVAGEAGGAIPGTLGPAWRFVKTENGHENLIRFLLRDVHLVTDLAAAKQLTGNGHGPVTFCTLEGDLVHAWGGVTVGGEPSPHSVLGVAEEIKRLDDQAVSGRESLVENETRVAELKQRLAQARAEVDRLTGEKNELARLSPSLAGESEKLVLEIERIAARRRGFEEDIRKRQDGRHKDLSDIEAARTRLHEMEARDKALSEAVLAQEEGRRETGRKDQELMRRIADLEVARAAAQEKGHSQAETVRRLRLEAGEAARRTAELEASLENHVSRISETGQALAEQRRLIEELSAVSARSGEVMDRLQVDHRRLSAEMTQKGEDLKKMRGRWETRAGELSLVSVEMAELKTRMEETAARCQAETGYGFAPEHLEVLRDYLAREVEDVRARAQRLKGRMARIGPVNMAALEEADKLGERLTFLTTQKEDLDKAIESLNEAIRKINHQSRERFAETFEQVAAKFAETFRVLFNGGEALLQLEEGLDLLEAGVTIYAQPTGKKMSKLSLLSGGEKAMTAIALLMAIFAVRPAPFCLMDEVDAPLDEVNIERFVKLISTTINGSQLVLITHSKRTMEMADNLVGVTMESPGVSKLVSVRLSGNN